MGWFKRIRKQPPPPPATPQMMDFLVGEINRIVQQLGWIVREIEAPLVMIGHDENDGHSENSYKLKYYTPKGGASIHLIPALPYLKIMIKGTMGSEEFSIAIGHYVRDDPGILELMNREELVEIVRPFIEKYK